MREEQNGTALRKSLAYESADRRELEKRSAQATITTSLHWNRRQDTGRTKNQRNRERKKERIVHKDCPLRQAREGDQKGVR